MRCPFFFNFYWKRELEEQKGKEESRALVLELFHKPIKSPRRLLAVVEAVLTLTLLLRHHWQTSVCRLQSPSSRNTREAHPLFVLDLKSFLPITQR